MTAQVSARTSPLLPMVAGAVNDDECVNAQAGGSSQALCATVYVRCLMIYRGGYGSQVEERFPGDLIEMSHARAAEWCDEHRWGVRI